MGQFSQWLLHEDQKGLFGYLYAIVLNAIFLALMALLLWPAGRAGVAWRFTKGYWVFWTVMIVTAALLTTFQRVFRLNASDRFNAYVVSGLAVSGIQQAGWSAYAALAVRDAADAASLWLTAALYLVGLLSCLVACAIVSAYYTGSIYRTANLPLSIATFALFSLWPAAGRTLYGWLFDLDGWFFNWPF